MDNKSINETESELSRSIVPHLPAIQARSIGLAVVFAATILYAALTPAPTGHGTVLAFVASQWQTWALLFASGSGGGAHAHRRGRKRG